MYNGTHRHTQDSVVVERRKEDACIVVYYVIGSSLQQWQELCNYAIHEVYNSIGNSTAYSCTVLCYIYFEVLIKWRVTSIRALCSYNNNMERG